MKRRTILAFMLDRPGVLNKVSMLIRRKMYNVDTLTVCKSKRPGVSRMTITLREDDDRKMLQVIKQIEKITEVVQAKELDIDQSYWRETAVIKLEADASDLNSMAKRFNCEVLDHRHNDQFIVQIAGTSQKIDDFIDQVGQSMIIEIARTGVTALEK